MIAIVDYKKGNLMSVERGLVAAGAQTCITDDPAVIAQVDAIVLPGVGAFADAAASMRELGQVDVVRERVLAGVPFLGICLGMHLLFEAGTERSEGEEIQQGLGLIPGVVDEIPRFDGNGVAYKIPHVGWNTVKQIKDSPLFVGIPDEEYFYFTHSFAAPESAATIGTTKHSMAFPSAVQLGKCAFGVQFHPEKSSDAGLALLRNFVKLAEGGLVRKEGFDAC